MPSILSAPFLSSHRTQQLLRTWNDFENSIVKCEDSWRLGNLRETLAQSETKNTLGPLLLDAYQHLENFGAEIARRNAPSEDMRANSKSPPSALRSAAVNGLLTHLRRDIFLEELNVSAKAGKKNRALFGFSTLSVQLNQEDPICLRDDQVLALQTWGIRFSFPSLETTEKVRSLCTQHSLHNFARDLRELHKTLSYFRPQNKQTTPIIVPTPKQRRLENLILDILNEHELHARSASLLEDFLEKTDLRANYAGLKRKGGARIQVTQITDSKRHLEKISQLRNVEELVVVSPLTLATYEQQLLKLTNQTHRNSLPERAAAIKSHLLTALNSKLTSPLGPLNHVPHVLRITIRRFVESEAMSTTKAMRERTGSKS